MHAKSVAARLGVLLLAVATTVGLAAPAYAAQGSIDHVETSNGAIQVLYSLPGAGGTQPDLGSLKVSLEGKSVKASAKLATEAGTTIKRTTILAMDVSNSMGKNHKFTEAQQAAEAFLKAAPKDLYVGIVTFAHDVTVAQTPTLDRAAATKVIQSLTLSNGTHLYQGLTTAATAGGTSGGRSILVLSDGRDTTNTPLSKATDAIKKAGVKVDVVALAQSPADEALLQQIADSGKGSVIAANDPKALSGVFTSEAQQLAKQLLITITPPASMIGSEGSLEVSVDAGGQTYTDKAFVTVGKAAAPSASPTAAANTAPIPVAEPRFHISKTMMLGGLGAAALGLLLVLMFVFGVFAQDKSKSVEHRIAAYTRKGSRARAKAAEQAAEHGTGVTAQAVGVAAKALEGNKGLESKLDAKLEAAGMAMKPAEWLLAHAGVAFITGLIGLAIGGGNVFFALGGLVLGAVAPWIYLGLKESRRTKNFKAQLADTLQLMSGSLSAGLSLAQSVDTVVREGADPMAGEFRRAIVEARLGVDIEDALDGVAERMQSVDFHWVVMAIRIQREVGGNLSELLQNVANTIREREYLERQVLALSAEGRLSVWILGGLPPGFMGYLLLANPTYLHPLISSLIGFILLGVMTVLLVVGIFWMKKLVKVDV
ncbi:MAG TPA: type II secretion system F family protein [Nocardioidaceae bacterium]|nr:type II secretion system F family protein [Nocardioidaceae bacterium]